MKIKFIIDKLLPGEEIYDIIGDSIRYYFRSSDGEVYTLEAESLNKARKIKSSHDFAQSLDSIKHCII